VPFFAAAGEISPGTAVNTDAQFEQFVKDAVGVGYHPLGTAAIGSVVDADFEGARFGCLLLLVAEHEG
jgi:choline dehydrogenase-like flavoprotein